MRRDDVEHFFVFSEHANAVPVLPNNLRVVSIFQENLSNKQENKFQSSIITLISLLVSVPIISDAATHTTTCVPYVVCVSSL